MERVVGKPLSSASKEWMFNPPNKEECAATGMSDNGRVLRGVLTQDLEHSLGEVLGSDGLFSTANDMFIFSQMILNKGIYNNNRIFGKVTVDKMTSGITN